MHVQLCFEASHSCMLTRACKGIARHNALTSCGDCCAGHAGTRVAGQRTLAALEHLKLALLHHIQLARAQPGVALLDQDLARLRGSTSSALAPFTASRDQHGGPSAARPQAYWQERARRLTGKTLAEWVRAIVRCCWAVLLGSVQAPGGFLCQAALCTGAASIHRSWQRRQGLPVAL